MVAAGAAAYSAEPPVKSSLATPKISSPARKFETSGPTASTTPAMSEPRMTGSVGLVPLCPSRINASHGPTPAAWMRTKTWPAAGCGRGTSAATIALGGPNWRIISTFMLDLAALYGRKIAEKHSETDTGNPLLVDSPVKAKWQKQCIRSEPTGIERCARSKMRLRERRSFLVSELRIQCRLFGCCFVLAGCSKL